MTGYREAALDPYRSPDALIEYLCTYMSDDKGIAAYVNGEFGGKVTEANVRAARKRIAKPAKEIEADNDDEFRRRKINAQLQNRDFLSKIRRAARAS